MSGITQAAGDIWTSCRQWIDRLPLRRQNIPESDNLERAVGGAFTPVRPPDAFRTHLASNLSLAAQDQIAGLTVEDPRSFRTSIMLGVMVGLVIMSAITGWLIVRSSLASARR